MLLRIIGVVVVAIVTLANSMQTWKFVIKCDSIIFLSSVSWCFFLYNFIPFHSATQSLSIDTEVIIFRALKRVQSFFVEWTIAKHFFISHAIKSISQLTHQCIHEFILCWKCQQFSRNNAAKWNNLRVTMFSLIFRRILNVKFRNWHAEGLLQSLWMLIGSKIALLSIVVLFWRIFFRVFSWLVMMWWECC